MNKQAPPLGNLTRSEQPTDKPLPNPKITPAKELVFSAPGVGGAMPKMDLTNVGQTATEALAVDNATRSDNTPVPVFQSINSRPSAPISEVGLQQLAGDESTPFNYTGFGAGTVGDSQVTVNPTAGIAKFNGEFGNYIDNPLAFKGSSDIVIANSRPVNQFNYTEGLTQSQLNSRQFFNGLQEWRQTIEPVQLPALQWTPQELNKNVAGGFGPTAETKGPLSWLVDGQQKDFNPFKLEFGGQGGGLLGGAAWVLSRLSPETYIKGVALDVSRSAAAMWEGGSAGLTELLKSGDFGKASTSGFDAMSENYYSNAPQARGLTQQTIFGSRELGDEFSQSYTLAAIAGMNDLSWSGQGQNPLLVGEGKRDLVMDGENFNPFGLRDPLRSTFNTGALEAKERQQGAWFGHGYDQWAAGAAGLALDIFGGNFIDKAVYKALGKGTTKAASKQAVKVAPIYTDAKAARFIPTPGGAIVHVPTPTRVIPDITKFISKPTPAKGGAIVPVTRSTKGGAISQVVEGEIVEDASAIVLKKTRKPVYHDPIANRYLPAGADPFATSSSRAYVPEAGMGIDFSAGGAIVPVSGNRSQIVPAVLGVGGKPGGVPINPQVRDGRVFIAGSRDIPSVTVWDVKTNSFVTNAGDNVTIKRVLDAPGKVPNADSPVKVPTPAKGINTPEPPLPRPEQPMSGLREPVSDVPLPIIVPKDTPNFTIQPAKVDVTDILRDNHTVDDVTGVFTSTDELAAINARRFNSEGKRVTSIPKASTVRKLNEPFKDTKSKTPLGFDEVTTPSRMKDLGEVPEPVVTPAKPTGPVKVDIPAKDIEYITAEAISPSVSSADIVRRLTSGDDIPGAVYNTRQVERQQRSIKSLVSLARQVTLPNGVRILSDDVADVSAATFGRLAKKVEAAITASGLNPSSTEASSIRRLFDRYGKPLPTNLSPDFSIEVAGRSVTSPASYVKPVTQVSEGNVTWTGRAARFTETYPLSEDYAVGVKVKYDDELKRIVPIDGQDVKMIPAVRTEPITRRDMLELPVVDRQAIVSKSFKDGFAVPSQAVKDATAPDILTDAQAAKDYAKANLPKDITPPRMDRAARQAISEHADVVEELAYTRGAITDISTQLTDVERSLNEYLKKVDELPDIGVGPLTDDVPFVPLTGRESLRTVLSDLESLKIDPNAPKIDNTVPIVVHDGLENFTVVAGSPTVKNVTDASGSARAITIVTQEQLPSAMKQVNEYIDDFRVQVHEGTTNPVLLDIERINVVPNMTSKSNGELQSLFERGQFLTPVVIKMGGQGQDTVYDIVSGTRYVADYQDAIKASGDTLAPRMTVVVIDEYKTINPVVSTPAKQVDEVSTDVSAVTERGKLETKGYIDSRAADIIVPDSTPTVGDLSPILTKLDDGTTQVVAGRTTSGYPRVMTLTVSKEEVPYVQAQVKRFASDFSQVAETKGRRPSNTDLTHIKIPKYKGKVTDDEVKALFERGSYLTPVVTPIKDGKFKIVTGQEYLQLYQRAVDLMPDTVIARLHTYQVPDGAKVVAATKGTPEVSKVVKEVPNLYHGTRVQDLNLAGVDPIEGAARSEYGTGVWVTNSQDIATSAAGRAVPANSVPNVNRKFGDSGYIHEIKGDAFDDANIVSATDELNVSVKGEIYAIASISPDILADVVPYGGRLLDDIVDLLDKPGITNGNFFGKVDELVYKAAKKELNTVPDELELTYVQRVITKLFRDSGVQGITNGTNTSVFDTNLISSKYVHDVSDIVGDASDDVVTALHEVNLLQRSLDAAPDSKLLQVQLAEAKAVAASKVRDSLADELQALTATQNKQVSELLKQDTVLATLAKNQRSEELIRATTKVDDTRDAFSKELNKGDWTGPCL